MMNYYQTCHTHYGYLTNETAIARELLERHGKPTPQIVKELRHETDMPMAECARMLRCIWRDMQLERLQAENARLRELLADAPKCETCEAMLDCDECLRADGMHKEHRQLSIENTKLRELINKAWHCVDHSFSCYECRTILQSIMRELGMKEVD